MQNTNVVFLHATTFYQKPMQNLDAELKRLPNDNSEDEKHKNLLLDFMSPIITKEKIILGYFKVLLDPILSIDCFKGLGLELLNLLISDEREKHKKAEAICTKPEFATDIQAAAAEYKKKGGTEDIETMFKDLLHDNYKMFENLDALYDMVKHLKENTFELVKNQRPDWDTTPIAELESLFQAKSNNANPLKSQYQSTINNLINYAKDRESTTIDFPELDLELANSTFPLVFSDIIADFSKLEKIGETAKKILKPDDQVDNQDNGDNGGETPEKKGWFEKHTKEIILTTIAVIVLAGGGFLLVSKEKSKKMTVKKNNDGSISTKKKVKITTTKMLVQEMPETTDV